MLNATQAEQRFIDDQFKYITLYELEMKEISVTDDVDSEGFYTVTLNVEATKQHADGQGEETEQPLDELIDIALFSDDPENLLAEDFVIYSQKHQIVSGTNTIELKVKEKPLFANARSVKNALDRARMRQANRIFDSRGQVLTKKELVNIEAQDILQSTIFD